MWHPGTTLRRLQFLNIPPPPSVSLVSFLLEVEEGYNLYKGQHYHCSTHAADVLRTLHVLCTRGGIWKGSHASELGGSVGI